MDRIVPEKWAVPEARRGILDTRSTLSVPPLTATSMARTEATSMSPESSAVSRMAHVGQSFVEQFRDLVSMH